MPSISTELQLKPSNYMSRVPEISSFLPPSDAMRYHWIEHFERSGEVSQEGWMRRYEPKDSVPSISYKLELSPIAFLLIAS